MHLCDLELKWQNASMQEHCMTKSEHFEGEALHVLYLSEVCAGLCATLHSHL
jgi:hypothetical protein